MDIDYDSLRTSYDEGLHNTLRNFTAGPADFLDTWVPDEDINRSVFGIFEAASLGGYDGKLNIVLRPTSAKGLKIPVLQQEVASYGTLTVNEQSDKICLAINFAKTTTEPPIDPAYQKAVKRASAFIHNEGKILHVGKGEYLLTARQGTTGLCALVDGNQKVLNAKHEGASDVTRVLLDQLCDLMVTRSIQEVSDHGVIQLEFKLRDLEVPRQVPGILTPENADPAFKPLVKLTRELYRQYLDQTKTVPQRNFWVEKATPSWIQMSQEEKIERIRKAVLEACGILEIDSNALEIVDIKSEVRVVLSINQQPGKPKVGAYLIRLERLLKEKVEPQLEIILESQEDKNKRHARNPPPGQASTSQA